jgi:capsular exopolysaccharide synthesis family protein
VSPNIPFSVALGATLGLLIGVGAAFLSHARDRSVRHPGRLQELTSVPVLSEVPADNVVREVPIAFGQSSESVLAEAYRRLRTNLQFRHGAPRNCAAQVVVVTAAGVGEGTSLTACNLARALAMSSKVMLVDANLRHPQVELYFGLEPGPGLTTVLTGNLDWRFARRTLEGSGLEILTSGPIGFQLGELLTWQRMDDLVSELRRNYDFVVIDAPALVAVSDAAAVAARADGAVLVVKYGTTREEQVSAAVESLRAVSAPLLGTVLNGTPRPRRLLRREKGYPEQRSASQFVFARGGSLIPPDRRNGEEPAEGASPRLHPDPANESTR